MIEINLSRRLSLIGGSASPRTGTVLRDFFQIFNILNPPRFRYFVAADFEEPRVKDRERKRIRFLCAPYLMPVYSKTKNIDSTCDTNLIGSIIDVTSMSCVCYVCVKYICDDDDNHHK